MKPKTGKNIKCPVCLCLHYLPNCLLKEGRRFCSRKCRSIGLKGVRLNTGKSHFKKGSEPWNKNVKGIHLSPKSEFKKGVIPWNNGLGMASKDLRFRWSKVYVEWRNSVFKRDNWTCVLCGYKGRIQADHIKSYALYPKLRLNIDNGRTLCIPCHRKTENYGRLSRKQIQEAMVL